jgi:cytochrome c-type biogenesis protein
MTPLKRATKLLSHRSFSKALGLLVLAIATGLSLWVVSVIHQNPVYRSLEQLTFWLGSTYERWFTTQVAQQPLLLVGLSFVGGLVASISPCILSLLPVNLSYIGTREISSRRDAAIKASAFVLGVVTVLSLLGLFSGLASFVLIRYRGYVQVVVGSFIVLLGLSLAGVWRLPLPQVSNCAINQTGDRRERSLIRSFQGLLTSPYGVGLTFALVSSPCTSPILFAVLAAAAATGSQLQGTLAMVSYALGYTAIIFLASLFTGLAKRARMLLGHSDAITRLASGALIVVGSFYLLTGLRWVAAMFQTA